MSSGNEQRPFGLPQSDVQQINEVLARHRGLARAIIYGSRALGTNAPGSDIDLTLEGDIDWQELSQISAELDDLLLPYQFDLSIKGHIDNPRLLEHIARTGGLFYVRDSAKGRRRA